MAKHPGGRGRRAENKHQTITISLLPELKAALDAAVTDETSRSEVVAQLISTYLVKPRQMPNALTDGKKEAKPLEHKPKRDHNRGMSGRRGKTERLALSSPVLHVMQRSIERSVRGQLRWTKSNYEAAQKLLSEGDILTADGMDYVTEKGNSMSWRTAEALVKQGILVVPPA